LVKIILVLQKIQNIRDKEDRISLRALAIGEFN
jgi:hypothetical protein